MLLFYFKAELILKGPAKPHVILRDLPMNNTLTIIQLSNHDGIITGRKIKWVPKGHSAPHYCAASHAPETRLFKNKVTATNLKLCTSQDTLLQSCIDLQSSRSAAVTPPLYFTFSALTRLPLLWLSSPQPSPSAVSPLSLQRRLPALATILFSASQLPTRLIQPLFYPTTEMLIRVYLKRSSEGRSVVQVKKTNTPCSVSG